METGKHPFSFDAQHELTPEQRKKLRGMIEAGPMMNIVILIRNHIERITFSE